MEKSIKNPFIKLGGSDSSFIGLFTMLIVVTAVLLVTFFKNGEFSR